MVEKQRFPGGSLITRIIKHTLWPKYTAPANLGLSHRRDSSSPSAGVWLRVTGQFVPDMRVCFTFNFEGQKSTKKKILAYDHWRLNRCIISKLREPIIMRCGVVSQKNWNVSYGDYLGHKYDCFSVFGCGQKCLTVCAMQQPRVIQPSIVKFVDGILHKYGTRLWTVFMWLPEVLYETWDFLPSDSREREKWWLIKHNSSLTFVIAGFRCEVAEELRSSGLLRS